MNQLVIANAVQQEFSNNIEFAYLFGSYATGRENENSDIDIAVLPKKPVSSLDMWVSAQSLARVLGRDVDLVNLMDCDTILRYQVMSEGCLLFGIKSKADFFEIDTIRMYQDLQFSRQGNIDSFVNRWK